MKVFALIFVTTLAAVAQASVDYRLQCTREEIGIRWPSYHSNSDYYVCQREGGRQMKMSCNPGELFTFVLQSCTTPHKFIPPPPLAVLPTSSPHTTQPQHPFIPNDLGAQEPFLPKPLYPVIDVHRPPVFVDGQNPPVWEEQNNDNNVSSPPHVDEEEKPAEVEVEEEPPKKPVKPGKPMIPKPNTVNVPMPPTPAPTPAILAVTPASKKQPPVPAGKKPPAPAKKSPPPVPAKKSPPAPSNGAKKSPPVPSKKAA